MPPGWSEIVCEVEPRGPGEFTGQLHLFVADPGTREIVFTVHGHAVAPAKKSG